MGIFIFIYCLGAIYAATYQITLVCFKEPPKGVSDYFAISVAIIPGILIWPIYLGYSQAVEDR